MLWQLIGETKRLRCRGLFCLFGPKTSREEMGVDGTKGEEGEIGKDKERRGRRRRG